jgi:hypothetical protein
VNTEIALRTVVLFDSVPQDGILQLKNYSENLNEENARGT